MIKVLRIAKFNTMSIQCKNPYILTLKTLNFFKNLLKKVLPAQKTLCYDFLNFLAKVNLPWYTAYGFW
jgi:hypothetical protein